ncbi:hypothetical protein [Geminocystis sp. GBBB08]|uniref:hypothetical protein n=1 Tax=Geminocystis sp. GBBB08 TaxID=2604140 RepID=UPI0027E2B8E4|nr:hypothetical protein [Geminocystis sp. GBBB08]MBL1208543.1 hypothetical protein [Geminocystis sp. GBBB08]
MKRFKIVESDNIYTLYQRNKHFLMGLFGFPFAVLFCILFIKATAESAVLFYNFCFLLGTSLSLTGLFSNRYNYVKTFSKSEDLHNYIAELKLKEKPKTYFLE